MWVINNRKSEIILLVLASINMASMQLSDDSPPWFVKQPVTKELLFKVSGSGEFSEPLYIECEAEGKPAPNYHWFKNGEKLHWETYPNRMFLQPGRGTLVITKPQDEDVGQYQCFAENKHGTATSNTVFVRKVNMNSAIGKQKIQVYLGSPFELKCQSSYDRLQDLSLRWIKDGSKIQWTYNVQQNEKTKSLEIRSVTFQNQGTYRCEMSHSKSSHSIELEVQANPHFIVEPAVVNAAEDAPAEFLCEANGVPQPIITWTHNGKPLKQSPYNPRRYVTTNRIYFSKVEKSDIGNYGCNASNSYGYVYKDVYLNIPPKAPEIVELPKKLQAVSGRNVTISCRVLGNPKPEVRWNFTPLTNRHQYHQLETGDLFIKSVDLSNAGQYTCFAVNKFGNRSASGELIVKNRTTIVDELLDYEVEEGHLTILRCNVVADSSLKLTVQWLMHGKPLDFRIRSRFSLGDNNSLKIWNTTVQDAGDYTCIARTNLDEVMANTTLTVYHKPNKIIEIKGIDIPTSVRDKPHRAMKRIDDLTNPEVNPLDAIPLGSSAFLLKWKRPSRANGSKLATGYKVYYEEFKGTTFGPRMQRESHIDDYQVTEAKLGNLKPDTKYRIHVEETTNAGKGEEFYIDQRTGKVAIEPDQPNFAYAVQPNGKGLTDVKITWEPNLEGKPGSHFFVKYRLKGANQQWLITDTVFNEYHYTVHDLQPNSIYEFCVVSVDGQFHTESWPRDVLTIEGSVMSKSVLMFMSLVLFVFVLLIVFWIIKWKRNSRRDVNEQQVVYRRSITNDKSRYLQPSPLPLPFWRFSGLLSSKRIRRKRHGLEAVKYDYPTASSTAKRKTPNAVRKSLKIYNSIYEELE